MNKLNYLVIFIIGFLLLSCDKGQKTSAPVYKTYQVKKEILRKTLYFSGIIGPIRKKSIAIPFASSVEHMYVTYGQVVEKNQNLIQLDSVDLQKSFNEGLAAYLKAKNDDSVAKSKFIGTQELWNAGLVSKNTYLGDKTSMENSQLSLLESKIKLRSIFNKIPDANVNDLIGLNLADEDKIKQAMHKKYHIIVLKAPVGGIILYPPKSADTKIREITVGAQLKAGQVIGVIGDLSGLSLKINVTEVEIDKISQGLPARVKATALPTKIMKGIVATVNSQAKSDGNATGGFPIFTARVEVPTLTPIEKKIIKVGMSASIEVDIESKNVIMVPIKAVFRKGGDNYVRVKSKQGEISDKQVTTGVTDIDKVVVNSGLQVGEVVLYE